MTPAQIATLRAAVFADPTANAFLQSGNQQGLKDYLNSASTFYVWRSVTNTADILDAITWANITQSDAPDTSTLFTNRAWVCTEKQMNLQILLQSRETLNTGKINIRGGLSDALTNVPSGIGGALLDAGWLGAGKVKSAITRLATLAEKAFTTGAGTSGTPGNLGVFEGQVDDFIASTLIWHDDGAIWTPGG